MGKPTLKTDMVAASMEYGKILSQPNLDIKEWKVNLFIIGIIVVRECEEQDLTKGLTHRIQKSGQKIYGSSCGGLGLRLHFSH